MRTLGLVFFLAIAPLGHAQGINICGSNCDPPGYGACPNTEERYFSKVVKGECRIDDRFKPRFDEWKIQHDRKAAQEQAEQKRRDAAIQVEIQRLGAHREAEARRLVEMREAAERARPKSQGPAPFGGESTAEGSDCRLVTGQGTLKVPFNFTSKQAAESALRFDAGGSCRRAPNAGNVPILSNLACKSNRGRSPIGGELRTYWSCSASFRCSMPHQVCEGKPARGSVQ